MEQIRILKYPEQIKSINKLLKSMDKVYCDIDDTTMSNVERLKKVIWNKPELFLFFVVNNDEEDDFTLISERWFISSVLWEEKFLSLLAKESLTNRIIMAYVQKEMSEGVKYRIRECIVAFDMYATQKELEEEANNG